MNKIVTAKVAQEIISHEAIVKEAYKDSVKVWTWSVGITNASGYKVYPVYKDNPQSLKHCLDIYLKILKKKYVPTVKEVFKGHRLEEHEFCAALSFHFNTGGLRRASWAKQWKAGNIQAARKSFMNWKKPPSIISRRRKERDLFFDGTWSNNGRATVYPVSKPSYKPKWRSGKKVNIKSTLEDLLG